MHLLFQEFRLALRSLAKRPGYSALIVTVLAICVGANVAIFRVVDAVLVQALPYRDSERLVSVSERLTSLMSGEIPFSAPDYEELMRRCPLFDSAGVYRVKEFELSGLAAPERLNGARVSASLFSTLGIRPALGRSFTEEEDQGSHRVVILNNSFWRRRFGADRKVLGRQITLDRSSYTVVGVMPAGFVFPVPGPKFNDTRADFYVPMSFTQEELKGFGMMYNHSVIARLKPGVTLPQLNRDLSSVASRVATEVYPPQLRGAGGEIGIAAIPLREEIVGNVRPILLLLFGAVLLVLLIGCADVAGMLLARAAGRGREMSIRIAIGASRAQLLRQVLVENVLLALLGGLGGLVLCSWIGSVLIQGTGIDYAGANSSEWGGRMMLFTFALSIVTALVFGLAPALRASQVNVSSGIRESGRGQSSGRKQGRLLNGLVVGQFALTLMLLVGAGLVLRSFSQLLATDPGFRPDHIVRLSISLPGMKYQSGPQVRTFYEALEARLKSLPGVKAEGLATSLPLNINEHRTFSIDGQPATASSPAHKTAHIWVTGDFFSAMGIPLEQGRYLDARDSQRSMRSIVINKKLARLFWPNTSPIGQRLKWGLDVSEGPWMTVVGVVGDVKQGALSEATEAETYSPWQQVRDEDLADVVTSEYRSMTLALRTHNNPEAIAPVVERVIHDLDPSLPVTHVGTMRAELENAVHSQRMQTWLLAGFACAALVLAGLGIGGVLAYSVAQRKAEIGIRMALGATQQEVIRLVLLRGLKLAAIGIAVGLAASIMVSRLMSGLLYETSPYDPMTLVAMPVFLSLIALMAVALPARRASTVDPVNSLRSE